MIDLQSEKVITLNEVRRLPFVKGRFGNRVSLRTLHRWRSPGVSGVQLESTKCGGTFVSSVEAVLRFLEKLTPSTGGQKAVRTSSRPDFRRAEDQLSRAGIV